MSSDLVSSKNNSTGTKKSDPDGELNARKRGIIPQSCEEAPRASAANAHRAGTPHYKRTLPSENSWGEIAFKDCVPSQV